MNRQQKWCYENKDLFDLKDFNLTENVDFTLHIEYDDVKGNILCQCGKSISLARNDAKIQVSNFYKHLVSSNCIHMKQLQKRNDLKPVQQHLGQSSASALNTLVNEPHPSPTQILTASSSSTESASQKKLITSSKSNVSNAKRRLTSQSQQHSSSRRSRI
ncbi:unnamed protein product [Adineta ricciae]|uniref:Uncharacterized protein n=1 Tax=Adineta ricciae TaxID=249248 RepID=A0A815WHV2_ADIRI|nr:unnamed protein product [Adineta ricciae]CAF1610785.1 unnamed protein product [Adineta ricciae]